MTNANNLGFLPGNDAGSNTIALQRAIDLGGEIVVSAKGIYDMTGTVFIGDNTTLIFEKGVHIRRQKPNDGTASQLFMNKGCNTGVYNKNITIIGLHIDCNGIESGDWGENSRIVGLRAQVGMIYVEDLIVRDFECIGLLEKDYAIQISAFKNILLEDIYCDGNKDGVHLGWGRGFTIRRGKFRTYDDPIALNAFDYSTSNTHVGWIEDGLIEDCYDLSAPSTVGFFCRILGGCWTDWRSGMEIQHSDTVCHNGNVYRAVLLPNGKRYTSVTPPTHIGIGATATYDGICWVCVREEAVYDCGCRNITIRNVHLQKERRAAVAFSLNNDEYARSYVKGAFPTPHKDIHFDNIVVENNVKYFLYSDYPSENISFKNIELNDALIYFKDHKLDGLIYPPVDITLTDVKNAENNLKADDDHKILVTYPDSI